MSDDLHELESEVDRALGRWADQLDTVPGPRLMAALTAAVHREAGEIWLTDHGSPRPSDFALANTRSAVGAALAEHRRSPASWFPAQAWGMLGAAAMLLICLGLIGLAGDRRSGDPGDEDLFVLAGAMSPASSGNPVQQALLLLETEVISIELAPEDERDTLEDLVLEIDSILETHEAVHRSSSRSDRDERGVLG